MNLWLMWGCDWWEWGLYHSNLSGPSASSLFNHSWSSSGSLRSQFAFRPSVNHSSLLLLLLLHFSPWSWLPLLPPPLMTLNAAGAWPPLLFPAGGMWCIHTRALPHKCTGGPAHEETQVSWPCSRTTSNNRCLILNWVSRKNKPL